MFNESTGETSIRRVLAFIFSLSGIGSGVYSIFKYDDWKIVAASFGVPILAAIILLFFTTWTDIATAIKVVKDA